MKVNGRTRSFAIYRVFLAITLKHVSDVKKQFFLSVCILYSVYSLQFAFCTFSAFVPGLQSAFCTDRFYKRCFLEFNFSLDTSTTRREFVQLTLNSGRRSQFKKTGSMYVSGKLPTYPSPNLTFCKSKK